MDKAHESAQKSHSFSGLCIRAAAEADLPAIAAIMNHYRQHTNHIWDRTAVSQDDARLWLDEHLQPPYTVIVAELNGSLAGYASLSQFRSFRGYDVTAENSIYLAPGMEGRGIGAALMKELLLRARQNGLKAVTAWIDSNNTTSVFFHEKFGFRYCGVMERVGILDGQLTSVIIMVLNIGDSEE